jgi:hypothetical protein
VLSLFSDCGVMSVIENNVLMKNKHDILDRMGVRYDIFRASQSSSSHPLFQMLAHNVYIYYILVEQVTCGTSKEISFWALANVCAAG